MSKNLQLQIPVPCHENWNQMTPENTGRFCMSCQKNVVDFTSMTDQQIIAYFKNVKENTCGRFRDDQLNRDYEILSKRKLNWVKYFFNIVIPAVLLTSKSYAQGGIKIKPPVSISPKKTEAREIITLGFTTPRIIDTIIKGRVIDRKNRSIPGATIVVKGTKQGDVSNKKGQFRIKSSEPLPLELSVHAPGYEMKEIIVVENKPIPPVSVCLVQTSLMGSVGAVRLGGAVSIRKQNSYHQFKKIVTDTVKKVASKAFPITLGASSMKIYPNPISVSSVLVIEYHFKKMGVYKITVQDMNGRTLQVNEINANIGSLQEQVKLKQEMVAGTYVVQLYDPGGKTVTSQRLIVRN